MKSDIFDHSVRHKEGHAHFYEFINQYIDCHVCDVFWKDRKMGVCFGK